MDRLKKERTAPIPHFPSPTSFTPAMPTDLPPGLPDLPPYVTDPRDDDDPLAPPHELRKLSYTLTSETFERRAQGLVEMRRRIRDFDEQQRREVGRNSVDGVSGNPLIHFERAADDFLVVFLRSKKFVVDAAFTKYLNFCRAQMEHSWLRDVDIALVERLFSSGSFQILPKQDRKGRLILSMDIKVLFPFVEAFGKERARALLTAIFGMLDTIMQDVRAQIFGVVIVSDLTNCKLKTFGFLSVPQYMLSLDLCQHCYPIRASGMYLIHEPWYVKGLFNALRPFMKPSVKENLQCFGNDISQIHKHIPKEALLPVYGGVLKLDNSSNTKIWVEAVRKSIC